MNMCQETMTVANNYDLPFKSPNPLICISSQDAAFAVLIDSFYFIIIIIIYKHGRDLLKLQ